MRSWRRQVWIDRGTDLQVPGHVGHRAAGVEEVEHLAPEVRRVSTTSCEALLQGSSATRVQESDSTEGGTHQTLH